MQKYMDAIVKPVAGPGLELRRVPVPVPGPGEVLIKVHILKNFYQRSRSATPAGSVPFPLMQMHWKLQEDIRKPPEITGNYCPLQENPSPAEIHF